MKKILLAASLAALLVSCGKVSENENEFKEPRFVQHAGQLIPSYPDAAPTSRALTKAGAGTAILTRVELTESGVYVVAEKDGDETAYRTGAYTVSGDTYNLGGFGTHLEEVLDFVAAHVPPRHSRQGGSRRQPRHRCRRAHPG